MIAEGLDIENKEMGWEELSAINQRAISSKMAITEFWKKYNDQEKILELGLKAMTGPIPKDLTIDLVPGAEELLNELQDLTSLALVTGGCTKFQLEKMKKAGIQPERFSKLIVVDGLSKKSAYQSVLKELQYEPHETIVCGDRVSIDLTPAKELGLFTIHFPNGRGKIHTEPKEDVDVTIKTIKELEEVLKKSEI